MVTLPDHCQEFFTALEKLVSKYGVEPDGWPENIDYSVTDPSGGQLVWFNCVRYNENLGKWVGFCCT